MRFEDIITKENFKIAHRQTLKGETKYSKDAIEFNRDAVYNLEKLREEVATGEYEFGDYIQFKVYEPKERIIHAPSYRDKIVQCAINNVMKEHFIPKFISDSYACIDKRGTHKCSEKLSKFMAKAKWQYGEDAYIVKLDIKKFFYSINRVILKNILRTKIACKRALDLIFKIIDSANKISKLGLPLGNTLSQICANIYMDVIDQIAKRKMAIKYYIRYADDIVAILKNKLEALWVLSSLCRSLKDKLALVVNEKKTKIFPIAQGVNMVGYKTFCTHKLLRTDSKKKIKRKLSKFKEMLQNKKINIYKVEMMIASWIGHARMACSYNLIQKILRKYSYLHMDSVGRIKIVKEAIYI